MSHLQATIAPLCKPYNVTRSRLGAITKVMGDRYLCDLAALKELAQSVAEKLNSISQQYKNPEFSFLVSFNDQTHHDGWFRELQDLQTIAIGKQTERVVLYWKIFHKVEDVDNELTLTVRISNPVNPLIYLQAALSKSASEIDNVEFEMGATCATVDGATHAFSDEIFLRVQNWIKARNKPHPYMNIGDCYSKCEWFLDHINLIVFPLLAVAIVSIFVYKNYALDIVVAANPVIFCIYFALQPFARSINRKMDRWANKSKYITLFQITNGDKDALTRMAATAKNSFIKLAVTTGVSFLMNVLAGWVCWRLTK